MKNFTHLCFLAFLCLHGSALYSQKVAAPPTAADGSPAAVAVYGQIKSPDTPGPVRIRLHKNPLDSYMDIPSPTVLEISPTRGDMASGTYGEWVYAFSLPLCQYGYLTIANGKKNLLDSYLASPGDSIAIFLDEYRRQLAFTGPAAPAFRLQQDLERENLRRSLLRPVTIQVFDSNEIPVAQDSIAPDHSWARQVRFQQIIPKKLLDQLTDEFRHPPISHIDSLAAAYRPLLPQTQLERIRLDALSAYWQGYFNRLMAVHRYALQLQDIFTLDRLNTFFQDHLASLDPLSAQDEIHAGPYLDMLYARASLYASLFELDMTTAILELDSGATADRLLARQVYRSYSAGASDMEDLKETRALVNDPGLGRELDAFLDRISPGAQVENFRFTDSLGRVVTLEELRGKTVMLSTFFTGCTASSSYYSKTLRQVQQEFADRPDLVFVSLSTDRDAAVWHRGLRSGRYAGGQALHLNTGPEGLDHPFFSYYRLKGVPNQMLIDGEGRMVTAMGLYTGPEKLSEVLWKALSHHQNHQKPNKNETVTTIVPAIHVHHGTGGIPSGYRPAPGIRQ